MTRPQPEAEGDDARDRRRHHAHEQRRPAAPDEAAQDVPSLLVGAEQVPGGQGRREPLGGDGGERIPRTQEGRAHGDGGEDEHDDEAEHRLPVARVRAGERAEGTGTAPPLRLRPAHDEHGRHARPPHTGRARGSR